MARKIECDGCGHEEPLRPDPTVKEARYESADGTILVAELCTRCRKQAADVFPNPFDLEVPSFIQAQPADLEWDLVDRSEIR